MEKEQRDLKQMQRVTPAASPGMCALEMGAWAAGRAGHSWQGPRSAVLRENKSAEKGEKEFFQVQITLGQRNTHHAFPGTRASAQGGGHRETLGDISVHGTAGEASPAPTLPSRP